MAQRPADEEKRAALTRYRAVNPHPERVTDARFLANPFFDALDLVQVKYEMVRRVQQEHVPVAEAARAFGFSRVTFYQAQAALAQGGLPALLPGRPGPRSRHKLNDRVLGFLEDILAAEGKCPAPRLAERVREEFALRVHPRSIERALARRRKGGRETA